MKKCNKMINIASAFLICCCFTSVRVNAQTFRQTLDIHLNAIKNSDLKKLEPTVADSVIHISPMGEMNKSKSKFMKVHEEWFKLTNWQWDGTILETESNNSMGYALIKYAYTQTDVAGNVLFHIKSYLTLIFHKTDRGWQLVYDQNTAIPEKT